MAAINALGNRVLEHVEPRDSILDLGCGIMHGFGEAIPHEGQFLGVDGFMPYVEYTSKFAPVIFGHLPKVCGIFADSSWDVVLLVDVLEHLTEVSGWELLAAAERIARKKVIVFTPEGFSSQDAWAPWGLPYCELQAHLSGWDVNALESVGYECIRTATTSHQHGLVPSILGVRSK
jgi:hypothetical protein